MGKQLGWGRLTGGRWRRERKLGDDFGDVSSSTLTSAERMCPKGSSASPVFSEISGLAMRLVSEAFLKFDLIETKIELKYRYSSLGQSKSGPNRRVQEELFDHFVKQSWSIRNKRGALDNQNPLKWIWIGWKIFKVTDYWSHRIVVQSPFKEHTGGWSSRQGKKLHSKLQD